MYGKLILTGAITVVLATPAAAEWNVLKKFPSPTTSTKSCLVVPRGVAPAGEIWVGGPFASRNEANAFATLVPNCFNQQALHNFPKRGSLDSPRRNDPPNDPPKDKCDHKDKHKNKGKGKSKDKS